MPIRGSKGRRYPFDRGKHLIVAVELLTYADETGTQGSPTYCLVSGFIGSPRQWGLFDTGWRAVLEEYCVPEFHAHEFFARSLTKGPSDDPYVGWEDEKARQFLMELVNVLMQRRRLSPVGGAICVPDYNSHTRGERAYFTNAAVNPNGKLLTSGAPSRPYLLGLVTLAVEALQASQAGARVHFVMDENTKEEPLAVQTFHRIRTKQALPIWEKLGSIRYAPSSQEPGLQAADLYNYVWQKTLVRESEGRMLGEEESWVWTQLDRKRHGIKIWTGEVFDVLLDKLTPEQREGLKRQL